MTSFEQIINKPRKNKSDWIQIAVRYYRADNKGLSQKAFASKYNLNYKSFNDAMNRYRVDIIKELNRLASESSTTGIDVSDKFVKPKSVADQFLDSVTTNHRILSTKKSLRWFQDTLRKTMRGRDKRVSFNNMTQGKLYTYAYDPLTKERLPYWDQYPLIIFLKHDYGETTNRVYFTGINLHYLSSQERVNLMHELLTNKATTSNLMKNTRLNVNWADFKNHPKSQMIIKNYLPNHVRSTIREIHPSDWLNIIKMPMQKFTTSSFSHQDELII